MGRVDGSGAGDAASADGLKISRESKFVKWCWWVGDDLPPYTTSICVLFWRGFVLSPVVVLVLAAAVGYVTYWIVVTPIALWVLGGIVSAIFVPIWAVMLKRRRWPVVPAEHRRQSVVLTVLVKRARAVKQKVCPIVKLY